MCIFKMRPHIQLQQQTETHLKPVLRENDYQAFDLDRAFGLVQETALRLTDRPNQPEEPN